MANLHISADTADVSFTFKNGEVIKAHRHVLATKNSVFLAMLLNNTSERQNGFIDIEDCDAEAFKVFIKYLYTGKVQKEDISIDLLQISDRYLDDSLKKKCEEELGQDINVDNVLEKFVAAIAYHCDNLKASTYFFIRQNSNELMEKPEFDELCKHKEAMKTLLLGSPLFKNDESYFQPPENVSSSSLFHFSQHSSSLQTTYHTDFSSISRILEKQLVGELVCSFKLDKEKDAEGITKVFLTLNFHTSYFKRCMADIQISLGNYKSKKLLVKLVRNIQVYKEASTRIFIIRDDDLKHLISAIGNSSGITMTFHFAFYDIVRLPIKN